jgi:thiamine kinase-like enzyme
MLSEAVIQRVTAALHLSAPLQVAPLLAGDANQVFRFDCGDDTVVVKVIGNHHFSGINRAYQYALQQQLAARHLAPQPLWLSDDGEIWVEEWISPDSSASSIVYTGKDRAKMLAEALANVHEQPITARPLVLSDRWRHYLNVSGLAFEDALSIRAHTLLHSQSLDNHSDASLTLCHNDLSFGHIIRCSPLMIVDWEYAAMGNRFFDLASCALINRFDTSETQALCHAYAAVFAWHPHEVTQAVEQQAEIVAITNALWETALRREQLRKGVMC